MMKMPAPLRFLLACALALLLAACGGSSDDSPAPDVPDPAVSSRIYLLAAPAGQLLPGNSPTQWTLVLNEPHPSAFWFEDRPQRGSGEQTLADYVDATWSRAYGSVDPNVTLHFQRTGGTDLAALYARMERPTYDAAARQLRVPLTVFTSSVSGDGGALDVRNLFLEVLNNAQDGQSVAFYLQHAAQAEIQPTGKSGQYRLVLGGTADVTLLAASAPDRYSDSRATTDFNAGWNERYAASAPNAALYGTTAEGQGRAYFFTLSDPQDDGAGGLSYAATALGEGPQQAQQLQQVALNIDSDAVAAPCFDYDNKPMPVYPKTVTLHNNSGVTLYPMLTVGAKDNDQWLQGCFRTNQTFPNANVYKLYVNETTGLAPNSSVTITLPLFSQELQGRYITWWNGGRVVLADDPKGMRTAADTQLAVPNGVNCQGQATACQLSVYAGAAEFHGTAYAQLSEYTFGDSIVPKENTPRLLNPENVGYNISYVDHVYMPVAIGPRNNPYIGYSGSTQAVDAFRRELSAFLNGPIGQGWPIYNMGQLRLPGGYNIFAERAGTLSPDADVPVVPPPVPPAAEGFPPVLTVLQCVEGHCSNEEKASLHYGQAVQRIQNLWGSCVDWGGEDLTDYVTATVACPADLRQKLGVIQQFFAQNHRDYLSLVSRGACQSTTPQQPVFNYWQAMTHIYGWVPFNEGCGAGANPLADTKIPGWNHARAQFMYIHDLQYNYEQPAVIADPALLFNPYVKLIHQDLGMSAYGFSVDDAVGFMSELGDGLVFVVGGPKGLENSQQFNFTDGFSVVVGEPPALEDKFTYSLIKKYGVCVIGADASDPQCKQVRQDVTMPARRKISGFRVGTVQPSASGGYPMVVRFTDLNDNVYTFEVAEKFDNCPASADIGTCPTNRSRIIDKSACIVTDSAGNKLSESDKWCNSANPNQQREAKEAQVIKNFLSFQTLIGGN